MTSELEGIKRLQVAIPLRELKAIEEFRFRHRMPSRLAAVRELLRRGLAASEVSAQMKVAKKNTKMR
jgi:hypothetical protein